MNRFGKVSCTLFAGMFSTLARLKHASRAAHAADSEKQCIAIDPSKVLGLWYLR